MAYSIMQHSLKDTYRLRISNIGVSQLYYYDCTCMQAINPTCTPSTTLLCARRTGYRLITLSYYASFSKVHTITPVCVSVYTEYCIHVNHCSKNWPGMLHVYRIRRLKPSYHVSFSWVPPILYVYALHTQYPGKTGTRLMQTSITK